MLKFCSTINGHSVCITPLPPVQSFPRGPDSGPYVVVGKREPDRWVADSRISVETATRTVHLAALAHVAQRPVSDLHGSMQRFVSEQVHEMGLPKDVGIQV